MNLTIDNNDGLGGVDYTPAVLRDAPLTITRRRGAWGRCDGGLDVLGTGLPLPLSRARVLVTDDGGAVLFRGFLQADAHSPAGSQEEPAFVAVEQDWLTHALPPDSLQPPTAAQHAIHDAHITYRKPARNAPHELATDVTVSGAAEPANYVTELFRGDGTTQTFTLAHAPFREAGVRTLVTDSFDDPSLNGGRWIQTDPGAYLSLGSGGLHMSGGNGLDGATLLQFTAPVEMGGTLVAEADGVTLATGSDGTLLGFYNGAATHDACIAGIRVRGAAGAHAFVAIVNGAEQVASFNFADGHSYTLRVRLHCAETQRTPATYAVLVDGVLKQFGGGAAQAPLRVVVEVQDLGLASSTLPMVLYDGALAASPVQCVFVPVNSTGITGSVARVSLAQTGSAWAVSTAADGTTTTRREGAIGTGADYALSSTGVLTFDPGRVPQPGELLTVTYRRTRRSVARAKDAAADQARLQLALPGLPAWSGAVSARSTADCEAAAQALLALATGATTQGLGSATWVRGTATADDVLPGDTLLLQTAEGVRSLVVQGVTLTDGNAAPELLTYHADFAQDRAASLSFTVSDQISSEISQPVPVTVDAGTLPPSLTGAQVTSATGSALQIDAGLDALSGGGFEVRRSDANFGSAATADLVLNSPVRHFTIPRLAFAERFFMRAYDDSTPRRYSPLSSAVLTSLPLS